MCRITISYVPLFYPRWPLWDLKTDWQRQQVGAALSKFMQEADQKHIGCAAACAWAIDDGSTKPILVLERGADIYKHINWWSQDKPELFFQFCLVHDAENHWYSCALMPNLSQSLSRMCYNLQEVGYEDWEKHNKEAEVIFLPLRFTSVGPNMLDKMEIAWADVKSIDVGIIDSALVGGDSKFDLDDVNWLRDIPIGHADDYLRQLHVMESGAAK